MRTVEFKMERTGLLSEGDLLPIHESRLPNAWYYTLGNAFAMSANFSSSERFPERQGRVREIRQTPKGYFVVVELVGEG